MNVTQESEALMHHIHGIRQGILEQFSVLETMENKASLIQQLTKDIQQLELLIHQSLFLNAYDQRQYQQLIKDLKGQLNQSKQSSKQKFSFKNKGILKKNVEKKAIEKPVIQMEIPENAQVFKDRANESMTLLQSTDTYLFNLTNCYIDMNRLMSLSIVHLERLDKTIVNLGHVEGSLFIQHLTNSLVIASCRQLRMHNCSNSTLLVNVCSDPIIEDCDGLFFGDYPYKQESWFLEWMKMGQYIPDSFKNVKDFNWIKQGPSPHWSILSDYSLETLNDSIQKKNSLLFIDNPS